MSEGGWIKMRVTLGTHPKVVRIASALNADRLRVIGALHGAWVTFDAHADDDGLLAGYTLQALDECIGWPGFAAAMVAVEWLRVDDRGITAPHYGEHNGSTAKRRAKEAARKRAARAAGSRPQSVRKPSASDADKTRTREEKRRVLPPTPSPAPNAAWWTSRSGIERKGVELGVGKWDQRSHDLGQGEAFAIYQARVLKAAGHGPWTQQAQPSSAAQPLRAADALRAT